MSDLKSIRKELKLLKKQLDEQTLQIQALRDSKDVDYHVEYLSQVFLTREEYPFMEGVDRRLKALEKKLAKTEDHLKDQVDVIEADAVEQRKLIEKIERRMRIGSGGFLGQALSVFGVITGKKGTYGHPKKKK